MVKDSKALRTSFPKDMREGLVKRLFNTTNLSRILSRSKRIPKACQNLAENLDQRSFERMLRERVTEWATYDSSVSRKGQEAYPRIEILYRLFKSVQARGGWRTMLGLGLWKELEKDIGLEHARSAYERYLSILDPDLHSTSVPSEEYFPPNKLAKWREVPAIPAPQHGAEIKQIWALEVCIFRKVAEARQFSLQTWAASRLNFLPIAMTEAATTLTSEPKYIHNALSLGVPLLLLNNSLRPCSVHIHAEALSSLTAEAQLVLPAHRQFVVLNPCDVLLVQGLYCVSLIGHKNEITRLSCLPGLGIGLLQVLERTSFSALLQLQVPFPAFALISELLQQHQFQLTGEERYLLASRLLSLAGDWNEQSLDYVPVSHCSLCKSELFLVAWTCTCGVALCPICKEVKTHLESLLRAS